MNDRSITKHSVGFGINRVTASHIGRKAVVMNECTMRQGDAQKQGTGARSKRAELAEMEMHKRLRQLYMRNHQR